jgi:hypothetical protein
MKKILIGLMVLGSISVQAAECVKSIDDGNLCISAKQVFADGSAKLNAPYWIETKEHRWDRNGIPQFDLYRVRSTSKNAEHVCQAFGFRQSVGTEASRKTNSRVDLVKGRYQTKYGTGQKVSVESIEVVTCL